jgi:hypothetical protein
MLRRWFEKAGGAGGSCDRWWESGSAGLDGDKVGDGDSSCVGVTGR